MSEDISAHMESIIGSPPAVACCVVCGKVTHTAGDGIEALEEEARTTMVEESESEDAIKSFFKRAYEIGFVMGSSAAIKQLREKATNRGRVIRIKAIWPPKEKCDFDEIQALLEMGD